MFASTRQATVNTFETSASSDIRDGSPTRFSVSWEIVVGAACVAVAFMLPEGYLRLVTLSLVSLCSAAWIVRRCQCE